jgi:hypothetical protein
MIEGRTPRFKSVLFGQLNSAIPNNIVNDIERVTDSDKCTFMESRLLQRGDSSFRLQFVLLLFSLV